MSRDPGNSRNKAKLLTLGSNGAQFADQVGGRDRADFFKINLAQRSSLNASLGKLKANVKFKLFNTNGQIVGTSQKRSRSAQQLDTILEPGSYYSNRAKRPAPTASNSWQPHLPCPPLRLCLRLRLPPFPTVRPSSLPTPQPASNPVPPAPSAPTCCGQPTPTTTPSPTPSPPYPSGATSSSTTTRRRSAIPSPKLISTAAKSPTCTKAAFVNWLPTPSMNMNR